MSRNGIHMTLMLACWSGMLWLVMAWGGKAGWALFYALSAVIVYACLSYMLVLHGMRTSRKFAAARFLGGQEAEVALDVSFSSTAPLLWVVVEETWRHENTGELLVCRKLLHPWFRRTASVSYRTEPLRRGVYRLIGSEATAEDLFGMLEKRVESAADTAELVVLPRPQQLTRWPREQGGDGGESRPLHGRIVPQTSLDGVRAYVPGDPVNRIHWRSSARSDEWKSRTSDGTEASGWVICLDAGPYTGGNYEREAKFELAVSAAAGLMLESSQTGHPAILATNGSGFAAESYFAVKAAPENALARLIAAKGEQQQPIEEVVRTSVKQWPDWRLFCVTAELQETLVAAVAAVSSHRGGGAVLVYYGSGSEPTAEERLWRQRLAAAGCTPVRLLEPPGGSGRQGRSAHATA